MVGRQAMSRPVAIGVGCRAGCPAGTITALVRRSLAGVPSAAPLALFTVRDKEWEPGIREAARELGVEAIYLPRDALHERQAEATTRSQAAETRLGLSSVAEAAALAGAGPQSVLIVPRIAEGGATCAIAAAREEPR
jgi:cobalt-precorrin 5A hydrolase